MAEQFPLLEALEDDEGHPVRPCIQCRTPLTYPAQPGRATCPACGVGQYLTDPGPNWPTGGIGREW
jgi:hypothetical protein